MHGKETAALWQRFRSEVLSGGTEKWRSENSKRVVELGAKSVRPPNGVYRLEVDDQQDRVWVCTPDYRRLVPLRSKMQDTKPSFLG